MQTAVVERETRRAGKRAPHVSLRVPPATSVRLPASRNSAATLTAPGPYRLHFTSGSASSLKPPHIELTCRDLATALKTRTNCRTTNGWRIYTRSFEHYAVYVSLLEPNADQLTPFPRR